LQYTGFPPEIGTFPHVAEAKLGAEPFETSVIEAAMSKQPGDG
jgi:hypothetical protein